MTHLAEPFSKPVQDALSEWMAALLAAQHDIDRIFEGGKTDAFNSTELMVAVESARLHYEHALSLEENP